MDVRPTKCRSRLKKCGKRSCKNPARPRYWTRGRLAYRKLRNLIRSGYSPKDALAYWQATRKRHYGELPSGRDMRRLGY